jgi:hypothetical protein
VVSGAGVLVGGGGKVVVGKRMSIVTGAHISAASAGSGRPLRK